MTDVRKNFGDMLKKVFGNNKNFKIK